MQINNALSTSMSNQLCTAKGVAGVKFQVMFNMNGMKDQQINDLMIDQLRIVMNRTLSKRFGLDNQSRKEDSSETIQVKMDNLKIFLESKEVHGISVAELLDEESSYAKGRVPQTELEKRTSRIVKDIQAGRVNKEDGLKLLNEAMMEGI